jgi:peptide/nickel transport system substrate-binding protein
MPMGVAKGLRIRQILLASVGLMAASAAMLPARAEKNVTAVLEAEVVTLDPHYTTAYISRTFDYLVFDTLFSVDSKFMVHPQMVDTYSVSDDKLVWTFTLRGGLKWHDGNPVTTADCIASLQRWEPRDGLGRLLATATASMEAVDAKTFTIHLKEPFPLMLETLGKPSSIVPFMIPERLARTPGSQKITEMDGSGPFIFRKDLWRPGDVMVLDRNPNYVPRPEPADFLSGGKKVNIDRLTLKVIPDSATQVEALQSGEIDYLQYVPFDWLPRISSDHSLTLMGFGGIQMFQGNYRVNAASGPFSDPAVRRVLWKLIDQNATQEAIGIPPGDYLPECHSFWMCNTPLSTTAGTEAAKYSIDDARAALKQTSYHGEPVVVLTASDNGVITAASSVLVDNLQKAGFIVDDQVMDWGTVLARRAKKEGWSIFPVYSSGFDQGSPLTHFYVVNNCVDYAGWSCDARVTKLLPELAKATTLEEKRKIAEAIQRVEYETVPSVMWGQFTEPAAYRTSLTGVIQSSIPIFWGLDKAGK